MLAYVFWHWPNPDVDGPSYEQLQRAFHTALAMAAPRGFLESVVFRIDGRPSWLAAPLQTSAYADWYMVENSAALDPLNLAAVSGVCEQPHAQVAQAMAAGAGSLFALRGEDPKLNSVRHAAWLTKPRTMPYAEFYREVATLSPPAHSSLWRRTMVLGPTPEFALLTPTPASIPDTFHPSSLALTPIELRLKPSSPLFRRD